jgi:hypothetical protein
MATRLKHRWTMGKHNYLVGITAADWWQLLRENRFAVDPTYWHRAIFISLISLLNSFWRRKEERLFNDAIARTEITQPPLFILGHWRSGTTHLHNLLALDTPQFAFPTTYQVVNPQTFLCSEETNTRRFAHMLPAHRPMDNMPLDFAAPQEDEFAPCLTTRLSPYIGMSFPRRAEFYERYLTFRGVPAEEVARWKAAFRWFAQKLTFKYGRSLVLKSPAHTARIRLLLEMFPDARFVHIHRDPYTVFQSSRHFYDTAVWFCYLQRPDRSQINDVILARYTSLYDAFFEERTLIPRGRFHDLAFADLERDPVREMRRLYSALGIDGFDAFHPKLERHLASLAGYEKNRFPALESEWREKIAHAWQRSFNEWGYAP